MLGRSEKETQNLLLSQDIPTEITHEVRITFTNLSKKISYKILILLDKRPLENLIINFQD